VLSGCLKSTGVVSELDVACDTGTRSVSDGGVASATVVEI